MIVQVPRHNQLRLVEVLASSVEREIVNLSEGRGSLLVCLGPRRSALENSTNWSFSWNSPQLSHIMASKCSLSRRGVGEYQTMIPLATLEGRLALFVVLLACNVAVLWIWTRLWVCHWIRPIERSRSRMLQSMRRKFPKGIPVVKKICERQQSLISRLKRGFHPRDGYDQRFTGL